MPVPMDAMDAELLAKNQNTRDQSRCDELYLDPFGERLSPMAHVPVHLGFFAGQTPGKLAPKCELSL